MKIRLHLVVIKKAVDISAYNLAQKADCVLSLKNRHGTRIEHNCDDKALEEHPEWLIEHYIKYGGAVWAAEKLRPRYLKDIEIPLHVYFMQRLKEFAVSFKKIPKKEFTNSRRLTRRIRLGVLRILMTRPVNIAILSSRVVT